MEMTSYGLHSCVEGFSRLSCAFLDSIMAKERPITMDEACALRLLLFGNTNESFGVGWTQQSFYFRTVPPYGFIQKRSGPCGVLAAVQAFVVYELVFGDSRINADSGISKLRSCEKKEALARALTEILWQAGENDGVIVAIKVDNAAFDTSVASEIMELDGLLEFLKLKFFDCNSCLLEYFINYIEMMIEDNGSCILFLYSLILTRGIQKIKEEMDYPESHLIGRDGFCSQEIINLILIGKAVANLFDGDMELNSGGTETTLHRGIPRRSRIGVLSLFEYNEQCTVGQNFKTPLFPIWVLLVESHFTLLFATSKDILKKRHKEPFTLYHYDGLSKKLAETVYIIHPLANSSPPPKDKSLPHIPRCIYTRWPLANIEEKEDNDSD